MHIAGIPLSTINVDLVTVAGIIYLCSNFILVLYLRNIKQALDNIKERQIEKDERIELRITESEKDIEKLNDMAEELFNRLRYAEQLIALVKLAQDAIQKRCEKNHK